MCRLLGFFWLILFLCKGLQAQTTREWHFKLTYGRGALLPEYSYVNHLANQALNSIELSAYIQSNGQSHWQELYAYPKLHFALYASNLGNRDVFGQEIALYPYFSLSALRTKFVDWDHHLGLGLGYASRKFDLDSNPMNIAVGSHLNLHFMYRTDLNFKLGSGYALQAGLAFHHFSNANMKEPNLGLNTVFLSLGFSRRISDPIPLKTNDIPEHQAANEFALIYAVGGKHTRALQSTIYFTSSISGEWKWKWKRTFHFGAGVDLFYDSATETEMSQPGSKIYRPIYDFKSGIHLAQEFVYNRFSLILQEGLYLGLTDQVNGSVMYNRAIVRYKWNKHFFTHISMKSHLHILDYPECGFAWYW